MVARVIHNGKDFSDVSVRNIALRNVLLYDVEADAVCNAIANGKGAVLKATAYAVRNSDFTLDTSSKVSTYLALGFTVYVVNNSDFRKIKNLYERTYA